MPGKKVEPKVLMVQSAGSNTESRLWHVAAELCGVKGWLMVL